jgi:hypothetical protein
LRGFLILFRQPFVNSKRDIRTATLTQRGAAMMSQTEYEAAVTQFLAKKGITRCPTACVTPTRGSVADADRAELRKYIAAQEGARLEKLRTFQGALAT